MANAARYLIVSDLHLADVEEHADGWMEHKSARYLFDEAFGALLDQFASRALPGGATLVLNGDIVDFDLITAYPSPAPWPVTHGERRRGLDATEPKSAWKLARVLDGHPVFLDALARFLAGGHRIVYVLGNHDRELHFPAVQAVLAEALRARLGALGQELAPDALHFEPWFFYVRGRLYAEHGQQYDDYTSFKYLLWPVLPDRGGPTLALPMGNVTNRYLMGRMGYFNPHSSDYILNVYRYFLHWLRLYAFSRRGLFFVWFFGSLRVIGRMLETKRHLRRPPPEQEQRLQEVAHANGLSPEEVRALAGLQNKPITSRMFRLLRELWVDRAAIAAAMSLGTVALALSPAPLWTKLMLPLTVFPLVYLLYEALAEGGTIFTIEKEIPRRARLISALLPARVVTFGHTHKPRQFPLSRHTTFVDTGTWAPVTQEPKRWKVRGQVQPRVMVPGLRTYLELTFHEGAAEADPEVVFGSWTE